MLTGRPYKNKQQSPGVGLRTVQYRHTFTEEDISNAPHLLSLSNHFYNLYTVIPKFTHNMKYHNGGILNAQYKANSLNVISTLIYTYYECWQSPSLSDNTLITLIASTVYWCSQCISLKSPNEIASPCYTSIHLYVSIRITA